MRLDYFRFKFKRECDFLEITDKVVLSRKPKIVYDYNKNTQTKYKQLDDVLNYDVGNGKTILDCINEMKDFPVSDFEGGRGSGSGGKKEYSFGHAGGGGVKVMEKNYHQQ